MLQQIIGCRQSPSRRNHNIRKSFVLTNFLFAFDQHSTLPLDFFCVQHCRFSWKDFAKC
jgi:hypothetical protein